MNKTSLKHRLLLISFGILLCLILLELSLRLGGFVFLSLQEYKNELALKRKGAFRILCLGDSTTAPITPIDKDSYPSQLEEILNNSTIGIKFSIINKGVRGTTSECIVTQLEYNLEKYKPDTVIVMMGINDSGQTQPFEDTQKEKMILFFKNFRTYKLARLLWLHILNKAQEIGILKPEKIKLDVSNSVKIADYATLDIMFNKALEANPNDPQLYIRFGNQYSEQKRYSKAGKMFKKAIEMDKKNQQAYIYLAEIYIREGAYEQAEEILKKAIQINPNNSKIYILLGNAYRKWRGRDKEAEEMLKKAIEIDPTNIEAYTELCYWYTYQNKYKEANENFKRVIKLFPNQPQVYMESGGSLIAQKKYDEAIEVFKKALELKSDQQRKIYIRLGYCYMNSGKFKEAELIFNKIKEIGAEDFDVDGALALCYQAQGKDQLAQEYFRKANTLRSQNYMLVTRYNYERLKEIVSKRGIKLVCVQYPGRNIEPLKKMFEQQDDIIFIDNETAFKNALKQYRYNELFVDQFGGDFGHCTKKGNKILAENIAGVILKEVFKK